MRWFVVQLRGVKREVRVSVQCKSLCVLVCADACGYFVAVERMLSYQGFDSFRMLSAALLDVFIYGRLAAVLSTSGRPPLRAAVLRRVGVFCFTFRGTTNEAELLYLWSAGTMPAKPGDVCVNYYLVRWLSRVDARLGKSFDSSFLAGIQLPSKLSVLYVTGCRLL